MTARESGNTSTIDRSDRRIWVDHTQACSIPSCPYPFAPHDATLMQWIQRRTEERVKGRLGERNQGTRKGRTSAYSNQKKGILALLSNRMKGTFRDRWICENEGKYNVITVNSSDTLVASVPRKRRKEIPAKSDEPKRKIPRKKTKPMPY